MSMTYYESFLISLICQIDRIRQWLHKNKALKLTYNFNKEFEFLSGIRNHRKCFSDFHKFISNFFKSHFSRLSAKAIYYIHYKNSDESIFIEDLILIFRCNLMTPTNWNNVFKPLLNLEILLVKGSYYCRYFRKSHSK